MMFVKNFFYSFASPRYVANVAQRWAPWLYCAACISLVVGIVWGLFYAPADYQQKDAFRIIYVHVPAAVMSMGIYVSMACASIVHYIWDSKVAAYYCRSMGLLGAAITALALVTGAIWGKPMWGTFWSWGDPRLVSELILLFLYFGYLALVSVFSAENRDILADKLGSIVLMVGAVNIPIIHYSVVWWNSLHQGATIFKLGSPSIATSMLIPLLICLLGFVLFAAAYALTGIRTQFVMAKNTRVRYD